MKDLVGWECPIFIDQEMRMNPSLSTDGVHLNENGYNLWVQNTMDLITSLENDY